jgi:hypothetical protein
MVQAPDDRSHQERSLAPGASFVAEELPGVPGDHDEPGKPEGVLNLLQ